MFEEVTNNWIGLHSVFDAGYTALFVPSLWERQGFGTHSTTDTKIKSTDVLLGYVVLFWVVVYLVYEKCLNSLLRRMRFPLMQRNRIIEAAWNCGFCFGSICYLKLSAAKSLSFSFDKREVTHQELGVMLLKSFYFHHAGIQILRHGAWTKGLANLLFASFILNPYRKKWCTVVSIFLFYKAIDTVVINICRILLCIPQFTGRAIPKLLFWVHCLDWIYLYILFVPKLILWPGKVDYFKVELGLLLWFVIECLDSIWLKLLGCASAMHWLEICLFPPPTKEAIELAGIQRRHKDSLKVPKKTELWQTLICAMALKKKIRKIRQAKQNNSESSNESTGPEVVSTDTNEEVVDKE
ncbi:hypothetical protein KM043_015834 [Ampulex compressa]|nr:hypothetical protein KM043_015834 [Ampulex compressa]